MNDGARGRRGRVRQAERAKGNAAVSCCVCACVCLFPSLFPLPSPSLPVSVSLFLSLFFYQLSSLFLSVSLPVAPCPPPPRPPTRLSLLYTHTHNHPSCRHSSYGHPFGLSNYPLSLPPPHTHVTPHTVRPTRHPVACPYSPSLHLHPRPGSTWGHPRLPQP